MATVWTLLLVNRRGLRFFDAAMIGAVGLIALVFVNLVAVAGPEPLAVVRGALIPAIPDSSVLLVAGVNATTLLLWSQTALCLVLPVALVPLLTLVRPYGPRFFTGTLLATVVCITLDAALLVVGALPKG